jgi:hypothetical protein
MSGDSERRIRDQVRRDLGRQMNGSDWLIAVDEK